MELLYNGFLTEDVIGWIKSMGSGYPHVVEISSIDFPYDHWREWSEQNMPLYTVTKDGCMDIPTTDERILYGIVPRDDEAKFWFFKSSKEKRDFIAEFSSHVINENPFKVIVELARANFG